MTGAGIGLVVTQEMMLMHAMVKDRMKREQSSCHGVLDSRRHGNSRWLSSQPPREWKKEVEEEVVR